MKKAFALALTLLILLTSLCACGGQTETVDDYISFDESRFSLSTAMPGVQFLYPTEVDNDLISYSSYDSYTPLERQERYFEYVNGGTYALFQPGNFAVYCISVGDLNHIEGKTDVNTIDHYIYTTSYITFSDRGDREYRSVADQDGNIKNTFDVEITDHMINEVFYGYLAIVKRGSDATFYALAVGYSTEDSTSLQTAEEIVDSFTLCNSNT